MKREIIIFANSLKHKQRCVAGKCITTKEWIRPVSTYNGDAINVEDTFVLNIRKNQKWPLKLLQRAEITFSQAAPLINHQPENLVVSNHPWIDKYKIEKMKLLNILTFLVTYGELEIQLAIRIKIKDVFNKFFLRSIS